MEKNGEIKAIITGVMWLSYLAMLWFTLPQLGTWTILLAFVMMMPLMGGMNFMWVGRREGRREKMTINRNVMVEKRKREKIDSVLYDLSDEELMSLKERLLEGELDEDVLHKAIMHDDGEILRGKR
jgi:hypothetical protein